MASSKRREVACQQILGPSRSPPTKEHAMGVEPMWSPPNSQVSQWESYPPPISYYLQRPRREQYPDGRPIPGPAGETPFKPTPQHPFESPMAEVAPKLKPSTSVHSRSRSLSPVNSKAPVNFNPAAPQSLNKNIRTLSVGSDEGSVRRRGQTRRASASSIPTLSTTIVAERSTSTVARSVPKGLLDNVNERERKRQEAINEVIYTECSFVRDLEYLRDRWMEPLRTRDIIHRERRDNFVKKVFWNIEGILEVSMRFRDRLIERQNASPTIEAIGDIFLELAPYFNSFIQYSKQQLHGKCEFEKERSTNLAFATFVETVERLPESLRLGLNIYLTKPVTHLVRYLPMLQVVLEHTPRNTPDQTAIPEAINMIRGFLTELNQARGESENRFKLVQLEKRLIFRPGEEMDLRLWVDHRQLLYQGSLKCRGGVADKDDDLHVFLLDHILLIVKSKVVNKNEYLEVFKAPIPLGLLVITRPAEGTETAPKSRIWLRNGDVLNGISPPQRGCQLTVSYVGRRGYTITLWAPNVTARQKWVQNIMAQQEVVRGRSMTFDTYMLSEDIFLDDARVNCAVPYGKSLHMIRKPKLMGVDHGRQFAYGTVDGLYFQSLHGGVGKPERKIPLVDVQQIEILEDYQLLIALAERQVVTFPLDAIDTEDPGKRIKRIASHTSFFKAGYCLGRTLVCIVKASSLRSMIKVLEPIEQAIRGKSKPTFKKLLQGGNDTLKVLKEFYIPNESLSIHFLKTKLCVACTTGFEIVDLETLDTQALLDPADLSLDFVQCREDVHPLDIYQIDGEFLLCYTEFAFFVNKSGWRSKKDVIIYWEGSPTAFALHYPYVMAIDSTFVEIRNVKNGALVQFIRGSNLRLLFPDARSSVKDSNNSAALITQVQGEIILASDDRVMVVKLSKGDVSHTRA
ncbi:unnamed protein product [Rhizoctonia solani]|uniref:Rho1 guanine nucleotide exchange factor 1 [Schizosaccharomyces pombe 972h-] n=1 Tax=Rhizoctonia solani TaxID=456999 RepID=A0A8H3HL88_9AGAM|nr:unnamed protein product [Rhizoctonia solani]